jgi:hypothetical protein
MNKDAGARKQGLLRYKKIGVLKYAVVFCAVHLQHLQLSWILCRFETV